MTLTYEAISDIGLRRSINQDMAMVMQQTVRDDTDSFSFEMPEEDFKGAAIVCDGLGGHARGEEASEFICEAMRQFMDTLPSDLEDDELIMAVKRWHREANSRLIMLGRGDLECTTLTGILFYGETILTINCGDSRTYRHRGGKVEQMSVDHSERERTGDPNVPSSTIYNCMGLPDSFIDVKVGRVMGGDSYLICSDGLCGFVPPEVIAEDFESPEKLLRHALEAGGHDNVTIVSVRLSE